MPPTAPPPTVADVAEEVVAGTTEGADMAPHVNTVIMTVTTPTIAIVEVVAQS